MKYNQLKMFKSNMTVTHYDVYSFVKRCAVFIEKNVLTQDKFEEAMRDMCHMTSSEMSALMIEIVMDCQCTLDQIEEWELEAQACYNPAHDNIQGCINTYYSAN